MKISVEQKNLFDIIPDVLKDNKIIVVPHVVNSKGGWGSGFVVPLGKNYPRSREKYLEWFNKGETVYQGPVSSFCDKKIPFELGQTQIVNVDDFVYVANMCSQTLGGIRPLRYPALSNCLETVANFVTELSSVSGKEVEIHAPMFGSNLAGGDFNFIQELIGDSWLRRGIKTNIYYLDGTLPENFVLSDHDYN